MSDKPNQDWASVTGEQKTHVFHALAMLGTMQTHVMCDGCRQEIDMTAPYANCITCRNMYNDNHNGFDLCMSCKTRLDKSPPIEWGNGYHNHVTHIMHVVTSEADKPDEHKPLLSGPPVVIPAELDKSTVRYQGTQLREMTALARQFKEALNAAGVNDGQMRDLSQAVLDASATAVCDEHLSTQMNDLTMPDKENDDPME